MWGRFSALPNQGDTEEVVPTRYPSPTASYDESPPLVEAKDFSDHCNEGSLRQLPVDTSLNVLVCINLRGTEPLCPAQVDCGSHAVIWQIVRKTTMK